MGFDSRSGRHRVLLHAGALGDLVLALQTALRVCVDESADQAGPEHAPGGLLVLSTTDPGDLSRWLPGVRARSLDGLGAHQLFAEAEQPVALGDELSGLLRGSVVLSALSAANEPVHARLKAAVGGDGRVLSFDPRPRADFANEHITTQWRHDLARQGARFVEHDAPRRPDPAPRVGALLHPGAGGSGKCWPIKNFLAVARRLDDVGVTPIRFVLGPAELERWPADALTSIRSAFPLETPTRDRLANLIASAAVFVGNDSGPAHLAALLGTPPVVVFGPTNSLRWRPLHPEVRVFAGDAETDRASWGIRPDDVADAATTIARGPGGQ